MVSNLINSVAVAGFNFDGTFNIGNSDNETFYGSATSDIIFFC